MKLICVKCETELTPGKNGVVVVEMFGDPAEPYKIWRADLHVCPICEVEIVGGFGMYPIMEHFEPGFAECLEREKESGRRIIYDYEGVSYGANGVR